MTLATGKHLSVGLRGGYVIPLTADGLPAAPSTAVFEGYSFGGPKAFTLNVPDARKITHVGNDRVLALDYLPPIEGMSGEIRVAVNDQVLNAYLQGVKQFPIGEANLIGWNTDKQGFEPSAALFLFQQSLDSANKVRRWHFYIIPSARIIPAPPGMDDNPAEVKYMVAPNPTTKHLWGTVLTEAIEGMLQAALMDGESENVPNIVAWKGDGTTVIFPFPTDRQAIITDPKTKVWANGVDETSTATITAAHITLASAPLTGQIVVSYFERLS